MKSTTSHSFVLLSGVAVAACGFRQPPDVGNTVGGTVDGLWDGAAVTLRLETSSANEIVTVERDGRFTFPVVIDRGESFSVVVDEAPFAHLCSVSGGAGIADGDVSEIRVACAVPLDVSLSAPIRWTFAHDTLAYDVAVSRLVQSTAITVHGPPELTISVNGADVGVDEPTASLALADGENAISIDLEVGTFSRRYTLTLDRGATPIAQDAYVKPPQTLLAGSSGVIAIDDGTLVVGAPLADAAFLYRRSGAMWAYEATLVGSGTTATDEFGAAVAIDGDIVVVGAPAEDGTTILSGAAYVFERTETGWIEQARLEAPNAGSEDRFGDEVAIAGSTIVIGAPYEDGSATGVKVDVTDHDNDDAPNAGAAYAFERTGDVYRFAAYIKASDTGAGDNFGSAVSISQARVVVGAPSQATAYVFLREPFTFAQQEAYLQAANGATDGLFASAVAIDGERIAIGAPLEGSRAARASGAVYMFHYSGEDWLDDGRLEAPSAGPEDYFGAAIALAGDVLLAGAPGEDGSAAGVDGVVDEASPEAGAAYLFRREDDAWAPAAYLKSSAPSAADDFGRYVAASSNEAVVGAPFEDSGALLVDGDDSDESAENSGAVYVFY